MKKYVIALIIICFTISLSFQPLTVESSKTNSSYRYTKNLQIVPENFMFDLSMNTLMRIAHKPSIAAGIIQDDQLIWSQAYGCYDLEEQKRASTDTLYLQASVSKTVTATALMQLYDRGLFDLDDDINEYLPFSLRNPNHPNIPITIKMILSHRSSLADDNLYWICLSYLPGDPDVEGFPNPWLEEYLVPGGQGYSASTWSEAKPGEEYYYANIGFSIVAYLVELLSGQEFNSYCHEHIFQPLDMPNTSFRLRDHNIDDIAVPYEFKDGAYFRHPHYGIHILYPAITLRTSIEEFSHFIIAHMNDGVWNGTRILNPGTAELMHTAHFSPNDKYNYGLGWTITNKLFEKTYGHSGGYVGVHDLVTIDPEKDLSVLLFSNELDSELHATTLERNAFYTLYDLLWKKADNMN